MKRNIIAASALAATVLLTAGACDPQDPCRDVTLNAEDQAALTSIVGDNPQVEAEQEGYSDTECVLTPSGRWVDEAQIEENED